MNSSKPETCIIATYSAQDQHTRMRDPTEICLSPYWRQKMVCSCYGYSQTKSGPNGQGRNQCGMKCASRLVGTFLEEPGIFPG